MINKIEVIAQSWRNIKTLRCETNQHTSNIKHVGALAHKVQAHWDYPNAASCAKMSSDTSITSCAIAAARDFSA